VVALEIKAMLDVLDNGAEKFELLSAYLDEEVTSAERKQVELWLQEDASFKAMYTKMRGMHTAIEQMPLPPAAVPVNQFADEIFAKIDQRRQFKLLKMFGGACAAGLVAAGAVLTATFQGSHQQMQMAKSVLPTVVPNSLSISVKPTPLMVALNDSIVQISPNKAVPAKGKADIVDLLGDGDDL
jgi:predicted anti-sigma-YlaC factor YlaD